MWIATYFVDGKEAADDCEIEDAFQSESRDKVETWLEQQLADDRDDLNEVLTTGRCYSETHKDGFTFGEHRNPLDDYPVD